MVVGSAAEDVKYAIILVVFRGYQLCSDVSHLDIE